MKKQILSLAVVSVLMTAPAWAAEPNAAPKEGPVSEQAAAVGALALATQLADYGLAAKDPVALIAAARIAQGVVTKEEKLEKSSEGAAPAADDKKAEGPDRYAVEYLLGQARELSGGDQTILTLADGVKAGQTRGSTTGPGSHTDTVRRGATDQYPKQFRFRGSEAARIAVVGDGDTDLDCYVYDENGGLIRSDTDGTDRCVLTWTPAWTGPFTLKIKNLGQVANRYTVYWN